MTSVTTATPPHANAIVEIDSQILGRITVSGEELFSFPQGLYGFDEPQTFALLKTPKNGTYWLQSTTNPALAFLLVDPFSHFPTYAVDITPIDAATLGGDLPDDTLVLTIVTLSDGSKTNGTRSSTANLRAPLLFNLRTHNAMQSIRPEAPFSVAEVFTW
jgi:flagellar assembly factor FliW